MESIEDIDAQIGDDIRKVIEEQREYHGICPLMRTECVGPNNCAPARFHMQYMQFANADADKEMPAAHAVCPIVRLVDSVSVTAQALLPLVLGPLDEDDEEEQPKEIPANETNDQRITRERNEHKLKLLANMKVDQQR